MNEFKKLVNSSDRLLSFELFPPKTAKGEQALFRHVEQLNRFGPDFITCTYGAGGSTRDKTLEIVCEVKRRFDSVVAAHLTLVNSTVDQLRSFLSEASDAQIDAIVALRGDPPQGETKFTKTEGGFSYANELVDLIHNEYSHFGVAVAGYPEVHQEAPNAEVDLDNLKRKVDAGADVVITQLFYDNADFFRFRDACEKAQINVPIVAGILPIIKFEQIQRIASLCAARLPRELEERLSRREDDTDWHFQVGVEHATKQVDELVENDVAGIHFYVLNRSQAVTSILPALENDFQPA